MIPYITSHYWIRLETVPYYVISIQYYDRCRFIFRVFAVRIKSLKNSKRKFASIFKSNIYYFYDTRYLPYDAFKILWTVPVVKELNPDAVVDFKNPKIAVVVEIVR